ncbi:hypothetical protein IAU60_000962 [Kwoniella sp. DSM 27419]
MASPTPCLVALSSSQRVLSIPTVHRTYGKLPPRTSSASSLFDQPSSPSRPNPTHSLLFSSSSSPPSSSRLETPIPSSPPTPQRPLFSASSSPLFLPADDEDDDERERGDTTPTESTGDPKAKLTQKRASAKPTPVKPKKVVQSSLKGFFTPAPSRKRPLEPSTTVPALPPSSKRKVMVSVTMGKTKPKKGLTQMQLSHLPLLHTCRECGMSFMRGGDDEGTHVVHHTRVLKGIVWDGLGKGKGKAVSGDADNGWKVVKENVAFGSGKQGERGKGRIIMVDGSRGGSKLDEILSTVDTVLSSPSLPAPILDRCKIFLFLTCSPPPQPSRVSTSSGGAKRLRPDIEGIKRALPKERVVSVVVAQGIKWAMRILPEGDQCEAVDRKVVESGGLGSVTCDPKPLPTPLGIHRLYTSPSYRSHGISYHLLDAACQHTIYGCTFDPSRGQVAFSQPTESGRAVMHRWGGGGARVFVDDESQL